MSDIILRAKGTLIDDEAREFLSILETRIATINERTKTHTLEIRDLRRQLKGGKTKDENNTNNN